MGPCEYEKIFLNIQGNQTAIFIPVDGSCDSWGKASFPGLVFAHGFTMMGFSDGVAEVEGHGEHLASWGYWLAIPALPDDAETRIDDYRSVIDFLLHATNQAISPVDQKIDPQRLAAAGYSLGGATALAASARDDRIQTAIALDPVYHEGGFSGEGDPIWNPEVEGIKIEIPTGVLGSPANSCNSQANYAEIYDFLGSVHKAAYQVTGASHCDLLDPANSYCALICGGTTDVARTA
ncbi:MAG: chlorophyllase/cutinase-like alpha/beta fold protein [Anaerolineales bacterium]